MIVDADFSTISILCSPLPVEPAVGVSLLLDGGEVLGNKSTGGLKGARRAASRVVHDESAIWW